MNSFQIARLENLHGELFGCSFHTMQLPDDWVRDDPIFAELSADIDRIIAKVEKELAKHNALPDWAGGTVPEMATVEEEMERESHA